jgi:hypothetical protein
MIEVVGAHWVRIEVHHPQKRGRVAHHDLSRRRTPTESAALLDPLGALLGGLLLENGGAIDKAFEHDGPPRDATQRALRDRRIVRVKLGVAGLRKEWLAGVRDHDLTASELQDGRGAAGRDDFSRPVKPQNGRQSFQPNAGSISSVTRLNWFVVAPPTAAAASRATSPNARRSCGCTSAPLGTGLQAS